MPMTVEARNAMLDAEFGTGASSGTFMSLHSADPTTTAATAAANEIAGGSPAYAAQQLNLAAAAAGAKALAANPVFDVQAGDAFSHYGLWNHATARAQANFKGSGALSAAEGTYGSQGTYTVTAVPISVT